MEIKVMAERQLAQKIDLSRFERPAWIRVRSPEARHEQEVHWTIEAIQFPLVLYFHDLDQEQGDTIKASGRSDIVLFSDSYAKVIRELIRFTRPDFLLINCEAGIRRSASIGAGIARWQGDYDRAFQLESFPYQKNALIAEKMQQQFIDNP